MVHSPRERFQNDNGAFEARLPTRDLFLSVLLVQVVVRSEDEQPHDDCNVYFCPALPPGIDDHGHVTAQQVCLQVRSLGIG